MILFILLTITLRCSLKFSLQSKNILRCFCNATWWTGLSLKINVGWLGLLILREKITSCACLRVVVSAHFPLIGPVTNFPYRKSLLSSFVEVLLTCTTEKREVSSMDLQCKKLLSYLKSKHLKLLKGEKLLKFFRNVPKIFKMGKQKT